MDSANQANKLWHFIGIQSTVETLEFIHLMFATFIVCEIQYHLHVFTNLSLVTSGSVLAIFFVTKFLRRMLPTESLISSQ